MFVFSLNTFLLKRFNNLSFLTIESFLHWSFKNLDLKLNACATLVMTAVFVPALAWLQNIHWNQIRNIRSINFMLHSFNVTHCHHSLNLRHERWKVFFQIVDKIFLKTAQLLPAFPVAPITLIFVRSFELR